MAVRELSWHVRALGAVSVVLFLVTAFTPAVDVFGFWFNPDRPPEHAEAIVVLGAGGATPSGGLTDSSVRGVLDGVTLFQQGWAPLLVLSGAEGQPKTEAEARADFARRAGVPAASIMTVSRAWTTREEALRVRELLQPRGVRKILLVVDGPGTVRAMAVFERVGFDVVPAPWSPDWNLDAAPEERLQSLRPLAMELVAWLYYRAMGYL